MTMTEELKKSLYGMNKDKMASMTKEEFDDWMLSFAGVEMTWEESELLNKWMETFYPVIGEAQSNIEEIKWKKQRAERGFSEYDTYEMDTWFLNVVPKMLKEIQKHPNTARIEPKDLEELIVAFENCSTETCHFDKDSEDIHALVWRSRGKALNLFVKHFDKLVW